MSPRQAVNVIETLVAPTTAGVKRTATQLAALGPVGLLLTPPAASADGLGKPAPPGLRGNPAPCTPQTHEIETEAITSASTRTRTARQSGSAAARNAPASPGGWVALR